MRNRVTIKVDGKPSRWQRPGQGIDKNGKAMRFTDPEAEAGKQKIAALARQAFRGQRPFTGPVIVRVIAIFAIPPSWPPALKAAAKQARVLHVADPDLDQIVKQAKDALKGIAYVDDNQVAGYPNSAKRYGYPERTEIAVEAVPQQPDEVTPGQRRLEKRIATEGWDAVLAPPKKRKASSPPPEADPPRRGKSAAATKSGSGGKYPPAIQAQIDEALGRTPKQ